MHDTYLDAGHTVTAADLQCRVESGAGWEAMETEEAPTPDDGQQDMEGASENVAVVEDNEAATPSTNEPKEPQVGRMVGGRNSSLTMSKAIQSLSTTERTERWEEDRHSPAACPLARIRANEYPKTDTATFYGDFNDPDLLSNRWEAVQTHWINLGFLRSIRD